MKTWKYSKLSQIGVSHFILPLFAFVVLFGAVGSYLVLKSQAATPAAAGKTGELASWLTDNGNVMCLDDYSDATASDTPVVVKECSIGKDAQQWTPYSDGTIRIHGKCLDVLDGKTANNSKIVIADCTSAASEHEIWTVGTRPDVSLNDLQSQESGKCLTDYKSGVGANNPVVLSSCDGTANQSWGWDTGSTIVDGGASAAANCHGFLGGADTCYYQVGAFQNNNTNFTASGVSANFTQYNPTIGAQQPVPGSLNQSNMEIFASSANKQNAIEIGWAKDSGNSGPHLFATNWINGALYSTTGFVQVSKTVKLNGNVTVGKTGNYEIQYANSQWQIWYNGSEVGYFPESLWTAKNQSFTNLANILVYGEVAQNECCTAANSQMGSGVVGNMAGAAMVSGYTLYNSTTQADLSGPYVSAGTSTASYNYGNVTATGLTLGGPGY